MAKCQRYQFIPSAYHNQIYSLAIGVGTSTTGIAFFLPLPTTMRAKATLSFKNLFASNGKSRLPITKIENYGSVNNGIWIQATVASGAVAGEAYYLRTEDEWTFIADANL